MAQYSVTYSCGHTSTKQLFGKETDRQRYIAWAADRGVCTDCAAVNASQAVEALETEHGLPPMTGSEKQIAWARTIRATKITDLLADYERTIAAYERVNGPMTIDVRAKGDDNLNAVMQVIATTTEARWWIDRRDETAKAIAGAIFKEIAR